MTLTIISFLAETHNVLSPSLDKIQGVWNLT